MPVQGYALPLFLDYVYAYEIWCVDSYKYTCKLRRKYCFSVRNYTLFRQCCLTLLTSDKFNETKACLFVCLFLARQPAVGQDLPVHEVSRSHTTTQHSRWHSSGRVISSSQRPLPNNTQHSQQTDIHAPVGFEPTISAGERPQTYALDRAATGTGYQGV